MKNIIQKLATQDWEQLGNHLHQHGFAIVKDLLDRATCDILIAVYEADNTYRKTINMQRYRFGMGEYKYFLYPLPDLITTLREEVYRYIAPVANQWMKALQLPTRFPPTHPEMKALCHTHGQTQPTVLILQYGEGGFNTLHQDLYGEIFFPVQMVCMLNEPGEDYTGGELVLTEQIPRAQSKASVLQPHRGDVVIFTTNFRPIAGSKGYYRANMKHGVSPVHSGRRHSLGIIFHDGLS